MTAIHARLALLDDGWAEQVRLGIEDGIVAVVERDARPQETDVLAGIVIPGLVNAHSHAFQRLLAGRTEQRGPGRDTFWTWRTRMYALARQVDAAVLETIATRLYTEMVATGYTAVAEFHYLHNEPGKNATGDAMFDALAAAAEASGIRLAYVPVLYERGGFDDGPPSDDQQRFVRTLDEFIAHYERVRGKAGASVSVGIGAHSLRAVRPASLQAVADIAARDGVPMHLHVAEQEREVDECLATFGTRPVAWLLDKLGVGTNWCLVHATHLDGGETEALAASGAVVCLCPSTEANLGDGLFPLQPFLEAGGRIAIGSDSHVTVNPFEELRWLEYGQRLATRTRNVAAVGRPETGRSLFEAALRGGAQAAGLPAPGGLANGAPADLVVLDDDSPMLAGHSGHSLLDALVFSGFTLPIDRVMVAGTWQVEDGVHRAEASSAAAYTALAKQIDLDEEGP